MMKSTGVVRKVDDLGRIVLPIELRRTLGIEEKDALEIYVDHEKIILKKYQPGCTLCGSMENLNQDNDKFVCLECISRFARYAESLKAAKR